MSTDNETSHLTFPLSETVPAAEVLILRDLDVVGVGSVRRHQIEELQKTKQFILQTYEDDIADSVIDIYRAELQRTLQWLKPVRKSLGDEIDLQEEHKQLFPKLFPITQKALGFTANRIAESYLQEMEWSSWLLQDHWRYFVGFLRRKFPEKAEIIEVAHWEWVQAWIEVQPFDPAESEENTVTSNPSIQIVTLTKANPYLQKDAGLYAFVFNSEKQNITERLLDVYEAKLLDLLQEDRKFSVEQLIDQALMAEEITPQISKEDWKSKFESLKSDSILIS